MRPHQRSLSECRFDLYDMCLGLAETLQVSLADFADSMGAVSPRELAIMRGSAHILPDLSVARLATIMLALQDEVNATYFRHLRDVWAADGEQGELFASLSDDDDLPF